jgi:hypothetical protein
MDIRLIFMLFDLRLKNGLSGDRHSLPAKKGIGSGALFQRRFMQPHAPSRQ